MPKRNILLLLTMLFLILSQSAFALTDEEEEKTAMENLATYSLAGDFIKTITEQLLYAPSTSALNNVKAMQGLIDLKKYNKPFLNDPELGKYLTFSDLDKSISELEAIKASRIPSHQKYARYGEVIDGFGFALDVVSMGTNAYGMLQNFSKAFTSDGLVSAEAAAFGVQNVWLCSHQRLKAL